MIKLGFIIILMSISNATFSKDKSDIIIKSKPIICDHEEYNCPSAKGNKPWKRLKNCTEVKMVWETCQKDVHGLDRDKDGIPCEEDCSP